MTPEEQTEINLVGGAASLLIRLLGNLGLSPVQCLAALDIATRTGRMELTPDASAQADALATRVLTAGGFAPV